MQQSSEPLLIRFSEAYDYLTLHVVPGPRSISYGAPWFLVLVALLIPPEKLSHRHLYSLFLPPIYAVIFHASLEMGVMDVLSVQMALWSTLLLALCDPRRDFRRVHVKLSRPDTSEGYNIQVLDNKDSKGTIMYTWEERYPNDLFRRLSWILTLLVSPRLTNWKIGEHSHDSKQPAPLLTRRSYFSQVMKTVIPGLLILDAASCYTQKDQYFYERIGIDQPLPDLEMKVPFWIVVRVLPPRFVRTMILAAQLYGLLSVAFLIPTLPVLGLNALDVVPDDWSPQTWHVLFGPFSAFLQHGLRGFWGRWWHQVSRETSSRPGRALAQYFGLPSSSTVGYTLLTISAFFFSGIMHTGLIPAQPLYSTLPVWYLKLHIAAFFWSQIPAIAFETAVSKYVSKYFPEVRGTFAAKLFTLMWILLWMCVVFPFLAIPLREMRFWTSHLLPISFCQWLAGNGWSTLK